jgi:AI-2E family transporter
VVIDINKAVADYVLGNLVISVLATIATWIVLSILGVPYALSLGFLVGFFDLIRPDRDDACRCVAARHPWSRAGHPDRRGDPDRAPRLVGQSQAPGADRTVVTDAMLPGTDSRRLGRRAQRASESVTIRSGDSLDFF